MKGPNVEDIRIPSKEECNRHKNKTNEIIRQWVEEQHQRELEIAKQGIVPLKRAISDSILIGEPFRLDEYDSCEFYTPTYKIRKALAYYWDEIEQWALQQGVELTIKHEVYCTKISHRWVEK